MSLLWRNRLEVFLAPRQVRVVALGRGFKPRRLLQETLACDDIGNADELANETGTAPWHRAAAALERWMVARGAKRLDIAVTLSNHFVRYALTPWSDGVSARDERLALARHRFAGIYGEKADVWNLCLDEDQPGSATVAAACDAPLVDRLRALAAGTQSRLSSLEPWFAAAFNANRRAPHTDAGWFAVLESDRVCAGYCMAGGWRALTNEPVRNAGSELSQVLQRLVLGTDIECPPGPVCVTALDADFIAPRDVAGWSFYTPFEISRRDGPTPMRVRLRALLEKAA